MTNETAPDALSPPKDERPRKEERLQASLHKILPLYAYIGLTVEQLGETVICGAPFIPGNKNHFGVMHAGVQFALAEAVGGISVTQYKEFAGDLFVARGVSIKYLKPARSAVRGVVKVDEAQLAVIRQGLAKVGKVAFEVEVELIDADGDTVSQSLCDYQFIRRRAQTEARQGR